MILDVPNAYSFQEKITNFSNMEFSLNYVSTSLLVCSTKRARERISRTTYFPKSRGNVQNKNACKKRDISKACFECYFYFSKK